LNTLLGYFKSFYKKLDFLSSVIILIPIALVTGPFSPDLMVVLANIVFLYIAINKKLWIYFNHKISMFFFAYFIYLIISSLISDNILLSLESSLFYFRFVILSLAIAYCINTNIYFSKFFSLTLLCVFIFLNIDGFIQFFFGTNLFGQTYETNRLSGIFGEEQILGSYLARLYPLLFGLMLLHFQKSKFVISLLMLIFILSDVLIFITGERTAFLLLLVSTILLIALINRWKYLRIITFIFSISIITLITLSFEKPMERMITTTINETNFLGGKINVISSAHEKLYITAYKIFNDNILFGVGPKMFREVCNYDKYTIENSCSTHPHNLYLQLMAETGIFGTIPIVLIFLFINIYFFRHFILKIFKNKIFLHDHKISFLIAIYCSLFPLAPMGNVFHNWLSIILFLPIGFLIHDKYTKN
jgi:O-antigen ligase